MAITAKFEADFEQFKSAVLGAEDSLKKLEVGAKGVGAAVVAGLASTELRRFASDVKNVASGFIKDFAEQESAVKRLATALEQQGMGPEVLKQYTDLATEMQKTTTNSDNLITSMQAVMVQVGDVMPGQMQQAMEAAANLAAGLGPQVGGLEGATLLLAKAFSGGGESLGRLKTILGDSVKPGADMAEVLAAIQSKFGGQAAAELDTYTGHAKALSNQMSEFKEKVGGLIVEGLTPLLNLFASLPEGMQTAIIGVVAIGTALAPLAVSIGALTPMIALLSTAFGVTMAGALATLSALLLPGAILIAGIAAVYLAFKNWDAITGFAKAVYEGIKLWLIDKFQAIVDGVQAKVDAIKGFFAGIAAAAGKILPSLPEVGPALAPVSGGAYPRGFVPKGGSAPVTVNMTGLLATTDPQGKAALKDAVAGAVAQGLRVSGGTGR